MKNTFEYSVLYYQPSQISEERYAIALLFFFPESKEFSFVVPESLKRLNTFLVDFDLNFVRKIFKRFDLKARLISDEQNVPSINSKNFTDIIQEEFLVADSSSLRFSAIKAGVIPDNREEIIRYYQSLFFRSHTPLNVDEKIDEPKILSQFNHLLKQKIVFPNQILKEHVVIKGEFFEEKFDYAWQNGKYNLIAPISFDLTREDNIKKKSQLQIGVLSNLGKTLKKNNYRINFLVAKPSEKRLYKAYDCALAILEEFQQKSVSRIIDFDNEVQRYIEEISDTARPIS